MTAVPRLVLLVLPLGLLLVAGCASPEETPSGNGGAVVKAVSDVHHGERFEPAELTVAVGDTVTFQVEGGHHTIDFQDTDGVSSPHQDNLAPGATVRITFAEAGTFRYHCQYHLPGMTGTVTVA